jgi:DNA-directed RNA polymerase subunit H (RpoH/RPB5)
MEQFANNESVSSKIYRSRKILLEQLEELGYDVSEYTDFSVNDIYTMNSTQQLSFMVSNNLGIKKYIHYHISKALRPTHIHELIEQLYHVDEILTTNDELSIITNSCNPSDTSDLTITKVIKDIFREDNIHITVRSIKTTQYNILNHKNVPKHRLLSEDDKNEIYKKYHIKSNDKLPEISQFDPPAVIIGLRPGQLCEITRPDKTSLTSTFYRICC